jgi:hypothetical protein
MKPALAVLALLAIAPAAATVPGDALALRVNHELAQTAMMNWLDYLREIQRRRCKKPKSCR